MISLTGYSVKLLIKKSIILLSNQAIISFTFSVEVMRLSRLDNLKEMICNFGWINFNIYWWRVWGMWKRCIIIKDTDINVM